MLWVFENFLLPIPNFGTYWLLGGWRESAIKFMGCCLVFLDGSHRETDILKLLFLNYPLVLFFNKTLLWN